MDFDIDLLEDLAEGLGETPEGETLLNFIDQRIEGGGFLFRDNVRPCTLNWSGPTEGAAVEELLAKARLSPGMPVRGESFDGERLCAVALDTPAGVLLFNAPACGEAVVYRVLEAYALNKAIEDTRIQLKHFQSQIKVMKDKHQALLEENLRIFEESQRKQEEYSESLESEIDKRTAELRIAYRDLEERTNYQQKILDTAATAIFGVDLNNRIVEVNEAFCDITGYSNDEVAGKSCLILGPDWAGNMNGAQGKGAEAKVRDYRCYVIAKDSSRLSVINNADFLTDSEGAAIGRVESFVDVTKLIKAQEEAETANLAKREFLAKMTHEIRTPLNGIIGMVEIARSTCKDDEQLELLGLMNTEAELLHNMVNEVLDFSKIEAGKLELEETSFDLPGIFGAFCEAAKMRAARKGLKFRSSLDPRLPGLVVGDPVRLQQVWNNLVGNALKFTNEGEIFLGCTLEEFDGDRVCALFEITDTGVGIPPDRLDTIFESFTQADGSTTRKYGGTGLGTTISKQLVELMEGEISAESTPGSGSTFRFSACFRLEPAAAQRIDLPEKAAPVPKTRPDASVTLAGAKVLLVEDYPTNQMVAIRHLGDAGLSVELAENGAQAVQAFERGSFDLIFMDIQMPVMDGFEATRRIRQLEEGRGVGAGSRTPIVAMTAHAMMGYEQECKSGGMDDFISKPLKRDRLIAVVERWVSGRVAEEASTEPLEGAASTPPLEFDTLVEEFEGDEEFAAELLEKFLQGALEQPARIVEALKNGDAETARTEAHSIKGGAANLFAHELSETAKELEVAARDGELEAASELVSGLRKELERVRSFYQERFGPLEQPDYMQRIKK